VARWKVQISRTDNKIEKNRNMKILKYGLQLVATLLAAFHGFLFKMSPPEEVRQSASVGIASLIVLIVFLFIAFLARGKGTGAKYKKWMCAVALACVVLGTILFFTYQGKTYRLTFPYPPGGRELYVKGEVPTGEAKEWSINHPGATVSELVASFGGVSFKDRVWTHDSIGKAEMELTEFYVLFVVILTSAVLCILEGLLTPGNTSVHAS